MPEINEEALRLLEEKYGTLPQATSKTGETLTMMPGESIVDWQSRVAEAKGIPWYVGAPVTGAQAMPFNPLQTPYDYVNPYGTYTPPRTGTAVTTQKTYVPGTKTTATKTGTTTTQTTDPITLTQQSIEVYEMLLQKYPNSANRDRWQTALNRLQTKLTQLQGEQKTTTGYPAGFKTPTDLQKRITEIDQELKGSMPVPERQRLEQERATLRALLSTGGDSKAVEEYYRTMGLTPSGYQPTQPEGTQPEGTQPGGGVEDALKVLGTEEEGGAATEEDYWSEMLRGLEGMTYEEAMAVLERLGPGYHLDYDEATRGYTVQRTGGAVQQTYQPTLPPKPDQWGRMPHWNERTGSYDYPPDYGIDPATLKGGYISPEQQWQQQQWQQQLEWYRQQAQMEQSQWQQQFQWEQQQAELARQYQQQQLAFQQQQWQEQLGWYQQQAQMEQSERERQEMARLSAQPLTWMQFQSYTGENPAVQPWMMGLLPQNLLQPQQAPVGMQTGLAPRRPDSGGIETLTTGLHPRPPENQITPTVIGGRPPGNQSVGIGQPIPGWTPQSAAGMPQLTQPSAQYWAQMSPTMQAQYKSYKQARTGQRPEDVEWWRMQTSPPSGRNVGLTWAR